MALGIFGALIHLFVDEGPVAPAVEKASRSPIVAPIGLAVLMWVALSVATITPLVNNKENEFSGAFYCWLNIQEKAIINHPQL